MPSHTWPELLKEGVDQVLHLPQTFEAAAAAAIHNGPLSTEVAKGAASSKVATEEAQPHGVGHRGGTSLRAGQKSYGQHGQWHHQPAEHGCRDQRGTEVTETTIITSKRAVAVLNVGGDADGVEEVHRGAQGDTRPQGLVGHFGLEH